MQDFFEKIKEFFTKNKNNIRFWIIISCIFIFINTLASISILSGVLQDNTVTYNEFKEKVRNKEVSEVVIDLKQPIFSFVDQEGNIYITDNPKIDNFKEYLLKNDITVTEEEQSSGDGMYAIIRWGLTFFLIFYMFRMMSPQFDSKMLKKVDKPSISFKDIAGNKELKKDMQFIVEFLKNPERMNKAGARMPKGVVLYGPPGTGKTLLAKAIAGEAGVPFYSASGSSFVEMYVGLGAKRVRDLYAEAKKNTPCIVFIDEIDAVGGKRGRNDGNSEKDQTINALLTELDGFDSSSGIITICATNRPEDLDEALVRPGRFDKQLAVNLPDKEDRKEIIKIYTKDRKYAEDVDFNDLANSTTGFSGADIEALMNEAALITATKGEEIINNEAIENAFFKMVMKGDKKENQSSRDKEELKLVAWHEIGHTLVTKLLTNDEVSKVTILSSTSGAGGVTFRNPPESQLYSKEYIEKSIKIMYGGRAAEELLFNGDKDKITTGASNDIKQATSLIKKYITTFGMTNEIGMLNIDELNNGSFVSNMNSKMLATATSLSNRLYEETLNLLKENFELLKFLSEELLQKETLKESEINELIDKFKNPSKYEQEVVEDNNVDKVEKIFESIEEEIEDILLEEDLEDIDFNENNE